MKIIAASGLQYKYCFVFEFSEKMMMYCESLNREKSVIFWDNDAWRFNDLAVVGEIRKSFPEVEVDEHVEMDMTLSEVVTSPFVLRDYQKAAVEEGVKFMMSKEKKGGLLVVPTAGGKSLILASIAQQLPGKTLVLQPSKEILEQNLAKANAYGFKDIGVFSASMGRKDIGKLTFATIGTIITKKELFLDFSHLLIDECFISGTMVGDKRIEDIRIGDYVESFNHKTYKIERKKVLAVSAKKNKKRMVLTRLLDETIISTYNHPFYVEGEGYVPAYKLKKGDKLYAKSKNGKTEIPSSDTLHKLRRGINKPISGNSRAIQIEGKGILFRKMQKRIQQFWREESAYSENAMHDLRKRDLISDSVGGVSIQKDRKSVLFKRVWKSISERASIEENDTKKSHAKRGDKKESFSFFKKNWASTFCPRRERERDDHSSGALTKQIRKRMVSGASCNIRKKTRGICASLQNRLSESDIKNSGRSRWRISQLFNSKEERYKKDNAVKVVRVESVESFESGSEQGLRLCGEENLVYNLEVADNNNFFANGVLVHNCHLTNSKSGMYKEFIDFFGGKCLGVTASPYRLHSYNDNKTGERAVVAKFLTRTNPRIFSTILHVTQVGELYKKGFLCPIKYEFNSDYDQSQIKLNSTGMDFDEKSLAQYNEKMGIVGITAKAIRQRGSKHVLVFTSSVDEAILLSQELNSISITSETVSAKTPKAKRAQILEDFKSGKIKVVTNVGTMTCGYDFPELDTVIMARPTQSVALYYQILGRGIRIAEGKKYVRVVDVCGNVGKFGRIEEFEIVPTDTGVRLRSNVGYLTGVNFAAARELHEGDSLFSLYPKTSSGLKVAREDLEAKKYQGVEESSGYTSDIINFGKHKGKHITKLPTDYLEWISVNFGEGELKRKFQRELERRNIKT